MPTSLNAPHPTPFAADPMSGGSSFSILLNPAPHLDMQYTIFGEVTAGLETLGALEGLETRREGIFVMPKERISILSTYVYLTDEPPLGQVPQQVGLCTEVAGALADRVDALVHRAHQERQHMLPGR
jgi:predicted RecA/RadA family phage recombinase